MKLVSFFQGIWKGGEKAIEARAEPRTAAAKPCMTHSESLSSLSSSSSLSLGDPHMRAAASVGNLASLRKPAPVSRSRKIKFEVPAHVFKWIAHVADVHNYGSMNKTLRALLSWAADAEEEDRDWMFSADHPLPACMVKTMTGRHSTHVHHISSHNRSHSRKLPSADDMPLCANESVVVEARLSEFLQTWLLFCVDRYELGSPCKVLDTVCRCAIALEAAEDIFESDESGRDLPTCTADLYLDLEIHGFTSSPITSPRNGI